MCQTIKGNIMKNELLELKKTGVKNIYLNGFVESINYLLSLDFENVIKISDYNYETK